VQRDNDRDPPRHGPGVRGSDRDQAIERVLRHALSAAAPADDRACFDGEILAAWTEGQLRGAEADTIERHLSTCARCQQLLAAFARTSPPPVVTVPLWRRWRLQWLVPIATAATVAAIWVATPPEDRAAYVQAPAASQAARAPEPAPARESAPSQPSAAKPDAPEDSDANRSRLNQRKARTREAASPPVVPPAPEKREEFERRLSDRSDRKEIADLQKTQAGPATTETDDARKPDAAGQRAQPEGVRETAAPLGAAQAPQAAPASPSQPAERSTQGALRGFTARQAVASNEIVSPNPSNRWLIVGDRQVQRTTNGGAQWTAVTLPSPGPLTAGSSPAPTVCWIIGRGGAIYLTTDGSRFIRIAFPEPLDLISITATDDRHATVTSADGRTFTTADQGTTWSAKPR
jgi:hypothetical protein